MSILDEKTSTLPFAVRKAMAFDCALENMPIFLQEGDLIAGGKTVLHAAQIHNGRRNRLGQSEFETGSYFNMFDNCFNLGQDERGFGLNDSSIPAYYKVVPMGIPALIADARKRFAETMMKRKRPIKHRHDRQ